MPSKLSDDDIRRRSVYRSMKIVEHLFYANDFRYFVTLTFSHRDGLDRSDYVACRDRLTSALNRLQKILPGIKYLLVPDYHEDGCFHFHGFFAFPEGGVRLLRRAGTYKVIKTGGYAAKWYCPLLNRLLGRNEFRSLQSFFGKRSLLYVLKYVRKAAYEIETSGRSLYVRSRNLVEYNSVETYYGSDALALETIVRGLGKPVFCYDQLVTVVPRVDISSYYEVFRAFYAELDLGSSLSAPSLRFDSHYHLSFDDLIT